PLRAGRELIVAERSVALGERLRDDVLGGAGLAQLLGDGEQRLGAVELDRLQDVAEAVFLGDQGLAVPKIERRGVEADRRLGAPAPAPGGGGGGGGGGGRGRARVDRARGGGPRRRLRQGLLEGVRVVPGRRHDDPPSPARAINSTTDGGSYLW